MEMTSLEQDPDFLRILHSADKEWPFYEAPDDKNSSLPLLISEIYRLIPYIGAEYVHFHPKNMPEIHINKVDIIGIVTDKTVMAKYTSYTVDDATGAIPVLSRNNMYGKDDSTTSEESDESESSDDQEDGKEGEEGPENGVKEVEVSAEGSDAKDKEKAEENEEVGQASTEKIKEEGKEIAGGGNQGEGEVTAGKSEERGKGKDSSDTASEMGLPFGLLPNAPYSYARHIKNLWRRARDEEQLDNEVELYDYVHVLGLCAMGFRNQKHVSELTDEDIQLGRLFFVGINIRRINETEYNAMTQSLINISNERYFKSKD